MPTLTTIGLGSNYGDRLAFLQSAKQALAAILSDIQCSHIYESAALLPANAPAEWDIAFLNAVIVGECALEPLALLAATQKIEQSLGRQVRGHWAPREIDIDILMMEGVEMQSLTLTLPHPEMHKREFVLVPLADVSRHSPLATHSLKKREDLCL